VIRGQAWLADPDDRSGLILDAEDKQPAGAIIGHLAHALGNVGRPRRTALAT
jgi:hypothetical protein